MSGTDQQLTTVRRAFEILELLWENGSLGVTELAERLDTHKSTVHGYLRTLESTGFVVNEDGRYRLSLRFLEIGGRIKHRSRLFHVTHPQLERLAADTGHAASLAVEENGEMVIVHLADSDRSLQLGIYAGMHVPIHSNASGKAVLAHDPELAADCLDGELAAVTEHTKTDPDAVAAELDAVRERGYAYDSDEQVVGMGIVAAPVLVDEEALGAVAVVCATNELRGDDQRERLAERVQQAANVIAVNYQYGR